MPRSKLVCRNEGAPSNVGIPMPSSSTEKTKSQKDKAKCTLTQGEVTAPGPESRDLKGPHSCPSFCSQHFDKVILRLGHSGTTGKKCSMFNFLKIIK
jgi:hypothetical protein